MVMGVIPPIQAEAFNRLSFQIDAASQKEGASTYRHVDNLICLSNAHSNESGEKVIDGKLKWAENPAPDFGKGWAQERYDSVFQYGLYNWAVTSNINRPDGGYSEVDGVVTYTDWNGLADQCQKYVDGGLKPLLMFQGVPEPISAGGFRAGEYSYNERQPSDYDKWFQYLQAVMDYLVDHFGADEVSTWAFCLWSESFLQFSAYEPETGSNESEFIKMYDYWSEALQSSVGKGELYTGIYFDRMTNSGLIPFIKHCASGTNYYTGETGSHLGWVGFSNWTSAGTIMAGNNFSEYYYYLENELNKYPSLDYTDIITMESGYLVWGNNGVISDVTYAENYGASYYAWRIAQYTDMPRLKSCVSFYNTTTGDDVYESGNGVKNNWDDNMLTPSFQVWKMSKMMENERLLCVNKTDDTASGANLVGCVATADDTAGNKYKMMVYNTTPHIDDNSEEAVELKLKGIPGTSATVTRYMIDSTNNNWWSEWTQYREENNIPYEVRGHGAGLSQANAKVHKTVWETTNDAGYQEWLSKIPEYKEKEDLSVTSRTEVAVKDGTATWTEILPGHSVLYIEVTYDEKTPEYGSNLDFEQGDLSDWSVSGEAQIDGGEKKIGNYSAKLYASDNEDAVITKTISGLTPGFYYTLSGFGKPDGNSIRYRLFAHQPGEQKNNIENYCAGLTSAFGNWNNMAVTKQADADGKLVVGCWVVAGPGQRSVNFDDLKVQQSGTGISETEPEENVALNKTVTASSAKAGGEAANAVDGDLATAWTAGSAKYPQSLIVDLGSTYKIDRLKYTFDEEQTNTYKYKIEGSVDKERWTALVDRTDVGVLADGKIQNRINGKFYQYLRLTITDVSGSCPASCREFEVYGKPTEDIAVNKPVTASSNMPDNPPEGAVSGNGMIGGWVAGSGSFPQYLQVDLCGVYELTSIKQTFADIDNSTFKYKIEGSLDAKDWTILADRTGDGVTTKTTITEDVTGAYRYVKMTVTGINNNHYANSRAFQIFGHPVDGSVLQQMIEEAEALDEKDYSILAWSELQKMLTQAKKLLEQSYTPSQITDMLLRLTEAMEQKGVSIAIQSVRATTEKNGNDAQKAIDGSDTTAWIAGDELLPQELLFDLGSTCRLGGFMFQFDDSQESTYRYKIEGAMCVDKESEDQELWNTIVDRTADGVTVDGIIREKANEELYRYLKLTITDIEGSDPASCQEFEVFGSKIDDLAMGKPVEASSATADNPPSGAVNGKGIATNGGWVAGNGNFPQVLLVDLCDIYELSSIRQTFADKDNSIFRYKIEGSLDKEQWEILADRTEQGITTSDTIMEEVNGGYRYVKMTITGINNGHWANSRAFEVFGHTQDYSGLQQRVEEAEEIEQGSFSDTTWNTFREVLGKAKEILDQRVPQSVLDDMLKDLEEAIERLAPPVIVESVALDITDRRIKVGNSFQIKATVMPDDAEDKTVTWRSRNPQVATVENGNVNGVAAGATVITAMSGEKSADCMVTVVGETYEIRTPEVEGASIAVTGAKMEAAAGEAMWSYVKI